MLQRRMNDKSRRSFRGGANLPDFRMLIRAAPGAA
jgi:hypothetical protein